MPFLEKNPANSAAARHAVLNFVKALGVFIVLLLAVYAPAALAADEPGVRQFRRADETKQTDCSTA